MRFIPRETGEGYYKASQIELQIENMQKDPYYNAQVTGIGAKAINLDEGALEILKRYFKGEDVLFRSDYIATTLWTEEDIAIRLQDNGYEGTQEEVDEVLSTGYLRDLGDCTDGDWQQIDDAIYEARERLEEIENKMMR